MTQIVKDMVTWLKQWFYTEDEIDTKLSNKANKNLTNANMNVVTDSSGDITTEAKYVHPASHSSTIVIESSALSHIGTSADASQHTINTTLDSVIGDLQSIRAIEIVSTLPTASSSTMGKLYIVSENSKVNVYYTKENSSAYSWQKMDTDILDELSISWNDVTNKPNFSNVATSGSYNDLSNKPSIPSKTSDLTNDSGFISDVSGKSDKTATIGTTITLINKGETNEGCIIFNTIS